MKNRSSGLYNLIDEQGIKNSIDRVASGSVNFNTYTTPKGLRELRIEVAKFLKNFWGYTIDYSDMLISSGSQQALNLVAYSLLQDGDTIIIEEPTYYGAIDVFKKKNINIVGVKLLENGLDLQDLEDKIIKHSPKFIYVTPTFNNPTGAAWNNDARERFLEIINKYNVAVVEDDPYSLINYTDNEYKTLYQLNSGKNVFYLGTFAKYISPSINVGFIISSKDNLERLYAFKESFDLCTSLFSQLVVLDYLKHNDLLSVVESKKVVYRQLLNRAIEELTNKYGSKIDSFSNIKGGLFFTVKFKEPIEDSELCGCDRFYINGEHNNESRINICSYDK